MANNHVTTTVNGLISDGGGDSILANNHVTTTGNGLIGDGDGDSIFQMPSLPRQSSIYSVTYEDFRRSFGEPGSVVGSMNVQEYAENSWLTMEDTRATAFPMAPSGSGDGGGNVLNSGGLGLRASIATGLQTLGEPTLEPFLSELHQENQQQQQAYEHRNRAPSEQDHQQPQPFQAQAELLQEHQQQQQAYEHRNRAPSEQDHHQPQPFQAQASEHRNRAPSKQDHQQPQLLQAQASAANAMYNRGLGNGGNGYHGYTRMASATAPRLEQIGMQLGGSMALGPNSLAQSPASQGPASHGINGHPNGLSLSPMDNYGRPASHGPASHGVNGHPNGLSLSPMGNYGLGRSMQGMKMEPDRPAEIVLDRKQKRMIKNRESAAKSRARKQAYTAELEAEVTQLKDEVSQLRKEKALETLVVPARVEDGKTKMRRTRSSTF